MALRANPLSTATAAPTIPATSTLPVELMPELNAGKAGFQDFYLNHPSVRTAFLATLDPAQVEIWQDHQGSPKSVRDGLSGLEKSRADQPGYLESLWRDPEVSDKGFWLGVGWISVCGALASSLLYYGFSQPAYGLSDTIYVPRILGAIAAFVGLAPCRDVIDAICYVYKNQSTAKEWISDLITKNRELLQSYESFISGLPEHLEQNPEIYDDFLADCLKRIELKIESIQTRRKELKREITTAETQKQETSTHEFSDPTLRESLLADHDEAVTKLQSSLELLQKWESMLNDLHQSYEDRRAIYGVKLQAYRKKLADVEYAKKIGATSEKVSAIIKGLESQIRAELTELAAMIETTSEFEARQLAAMEVRLTAVPVKKSVVDSLSI